MVISPKNHLAKLKIYLFESGSRQVYSSLCEWTTDNRKNGSLSRDMSAIIHCTLLERKIK